MTKEPAPREQALFIAFEARHDYPGKDTVVSRALDVLFIMSIRYWILSQNTQEGGWLKALYHPQIGEVLGYIHQEPDRNWTVQSLAETVSMSRSSLANQFAEMVGEAPMTYLTRWRVQLAAMWLVEDHSLTIEAVAQRVGYSSAYTFSKAFKRVVGLSPHHYRQDYILNHLGSAAN